MVYMNYIPTMLLKHTHIQRFRGPLLAGFSRQKAPAQEGSSSTENRMQPALLLWKMELSTRAQLPRESTWSPLLAPTIFWSGLVLGYELDDLLTLLSVIPYRRKLKKNIKENSFSFSPT